MTSYVGRGIELNEIKVEVSDKKEAVRASAKCLLCGQFIVLNVIGVRAISINNYKRHVSLKHVRVAKGLTVKGQPSVSSMLMGTQKKENKSATPFAAALKSQKTRSSSVDDADSENEDLFNPVLPREWMQPDTPVEGEIDIERLEFVTDANIIEDGGDGTSVDIVVIEETSEN